MSLTPTTGGHRVVLLADDNEDDVFLFKRAYKTAGITHPQRVVGDGQQAIEYLRTANEGQNLRPALIFVDLKMPVLGGIDVIRWVRSQPEFQQMPVIVVTTSAGGDDIKRAYEAGADSFVTKSLSNHEFVAGLRGVKQHWLAP